MFIEPKTPVTINDLLYGLIVQSGNDAAVALGKSPSTIKTWCAAQSLSYTMKTQALQPAPVGSMTPELRQAIADASAEIAAGTAPPFKPKGY
jgi:hypothetical protein